MKSISFKVGLIYILFSVFTISLFTVSIYIEQIGLIVKNRELEALLRTEKVYVPLKYSLLDSLDIDLHQVSRDVLITKLNLILDEITNEEYLIFTEKGEILYKSSGELTLDENNRTDAISAIANKEFMNQAYLLQTNDTDEADLYIPVGTGRTEVIILLFKYKMENLETNLLSLYRVVITVIGIVLAFQIIFAIVFYSMVIRPVKEINKRSLEIKGGNLSSRVSIKRKDELG
ncbi:MAG: hypothetical protein JXB88_20595, partial [Spirochaetales bacterium]|nr:hypothetical protein [Spirochaetales bacterium]